MSCLCSVCVRHVGTQLVPDRSEHDPPYRFQVMCPLCLDAFCDLFPLRPETLFRRQLTGKRPLLPPKRKKKLKTAVPG